MVFHEPMRLRNLKVFIYFVIKYVKLHQCAWKTCMTLLLAIDINIGVQKEIQEYISDGEL